MYLNCLPTCPNIRIRRQRKNLLIILKHQVSCYLKRISKILNLVGHKRLEITMAQKLLKKELVNTKLANNYGGWIYCSGCNQTIGYLCYVTYGSIIMEYSCKCGND